jgi:hypothetical protein
MVYGTISSARLADALLLGRHLLPRGAWLHQEFKTVFSDAEGDGKGV